MSISRKLLRQAIGYDLAEIYVGTTGTNTTTTLTCPELEDSTAQAESWENAWVLIVSGARAGTLRKVASYDPDTGTITVSRAWETPAASSEFELHRLLSPLDINTLINRALSGLAYTVAQEIDTVDAQKEYDLSAYTWLVEPGQVYNVDAKLDDGQGGYRYVQLPWYDIQNVGTSLSLFVDGYSSTSVTDLVLRAWRHYDELDEDTDTTDCPQDWVSSAARAGVLLHMTQTTPVEDSRRYKEAWALESSRFMRLSMRYVPRVASRIMHRDAGV